MLTNLDWLPTPPTNFNERLRVLRRDAASHSTTSLTESVVSLATSALDENQLNKLSRFVDFLLEQGRPDLGLLRLKLGLVGDGTLSLLAPAIVGSGLRHGLLLEIVEGGYNSAVQEAVDRSSPLHAAGLDIVLIASDTRLLGLSSSGVVSRGGRSENRRGVSENKADRGQPEGLGLDGDFHPNARAAAGAVVWQLRSN